MLLLIVDRTKQGGLMSDLLDELGGILYSIFIILLGLCVAVIAVCLTAACVGWVLHLFGVVNGGF